MNDSQTRPSPGRPVFPINAHGDWPGCQPGPTGIKRPIVGPHTPLLRIPRQKVSLPYTLKVVEGGGLRILSTSRVASPLEAVGALKLLGSISSQPVLLNGSLAEFLEPAR